MSINYESMLWAERPERRWPAAAAEWVFVLALAVLCAVACTRPWVSVGRVRAAAPVAGGVVVTSDVAGRAVGASAAYLAGRRDAPSPGTWVLAVGEPQTAGERTVLGVRGRVVEVTPPAWLDRAGDVAGLLVGAAAGRPWATVTAAVIVVLAGRALVAAGALAAGAAAVGVAALGCAVALVPAERPDFAQTVGVAAAGGALIGAIVGLLDPAHIFNRLAAVSGVLMVTRPTAGGDLWLDTAMSLLAAVSPRQLGPAAVGAAAVGWSYPDRPLLATAVAYAGLATFALLGGAARQRGPYRV